MGIAAINLALERLAFDPDIPGVVQLMLVTMVIGAYDAFAGSDSRPGTWFAALRGRSLGEETPPPGRTSIIAVWIQTSDRPLRRCGTAFPGRPVPCKRVR